MEHPSGSQETAEGSFRPRTESPHDALFLYTFSSVEHAAGALRAMLPPALAAEVDFSTLSLSPGHFVDSQLDGRRTDLLFSARIAGRKAFVYLLFEHQSSADALMLLRLLEYMTRIWRAFLVEHPKATRLPPIVPVVRHHSKRGWHVARRFEELIDLDEGIRETLTEFIPRFGIVLDDISSMDDAVLKQRAMTALGRLVFYLFRHARSPEQLFEGLGRWTDVLVEVADSPNGGAAIAAVLEYLRSVTRRDETEVVMALNQAVGESVAERIFKAGERLEEKGVLRGLAPLVHLFERRLRRSLSTDERTRLAARLRDQGAERVGDVVLDLTPEELASWLAGTNPP